MVKRLVLLVLILLCSIIGRANVDFIVTLYGKHVKIKTVVGGGADQEIIPKLDILIKIIEKFNSQHWNNNTYVYIELCPTMYIRSDSDTDKLHNYDLSYDPVLFVADDDVKYYGPKVEEQLHCEIHKALHLRHTNTIIDPITCLKLLQFGVDNETIIKSYQQARTRYGFDSSWLLFKNVDNIVNPKESWESSVDSYKIYSRRNFFSGIDSALNYYYQNDSFYIYKVDEPDKILYTTKTIYRITYKGDDCLVFENDSSFYHLTLQNGKITGPHILPYYYYNNHGRIEDISVDNNKMLITVHGLDRYVAIFDLSTKTVEIDTSSINENARQMVARDKQWKKYKEGKEQAQIDDSRNRKKNVLLIATFFALLTVALIAYQRNR